MKPEQLIELAEQAQRNGVQKVGGRGPERRLELDDLILYTEVGQPLSSADGVMIGTIVVFFVLLGVTILLWADYEEYMLIPIGLMVLTVTFFFRATSTGTREMMERQDSVESRGLYLAKKSLFYNQEEESLWIPRDRAVELRSVPRADRTDIWVLDYRTDAGEVESFEMFSNTAATRPWADAVRRWLDDELLPDTW